MYCGIPLISTDCPSGPQEILQDGEYGCLVPVGDELALSQAIIDALDKKVLQPPDESWQRFRLENVVTQYLDIMFDNNNE